MLTNLGPNQLHKMGQRFNTVRLVNQARYTLKLASDDAAVTAMLGKELVGTAQGALLKLEQAVAGRGVAYASSKAALQKQVQQMQRAVVWRRAFVNRMRIAKRRALVDVPPHAMRVTEGTRTAGSLSADLDRLIEIAAELGPVVVSAGVTPEFVKQGVEVSKALKQSEQDQEILFRARRNEAVVELQRLKAVVYLAVKQVNDAGKSVHAADRSKAALYNLAILRRNLPTPAPDVQSKPAAGPPQAHAESA